MTTGRMGQALTAVKRTKVTMSMTVMSQTLGEKDDSSDVTLAFINSDEEDAKDSPHAKRSGQAIARRS